MGYDAIGISENDLLAGYDFFNNGYIDSLPLVSANVYTDDGHLFFLPHIIKQIGPIKAAIIGLTGLGASRYENLTVKDWRPALQMELEKLRPLCDLFVILSNLTEHENIELQKKYPQIDIIISTNSKKPNTAPQIIGQTLMSQSGKRGKYIGTVDITWNGHQSWQPKGLTTLEQLKNKLKTVEWYISEFTKQQKDTTKAQQNDRIAQLEKSRKNLEEQINAAQSNNNVTVPQPSNTYSSQFIPVKPSTTPIQIQNIVDDIVDSINSYNKLRQSQLRSKTHLQPNKSLLGEQIAGYMVCSSCHEKQYLFWKETQHATAFDTLYNNGQAYNLSCVPCHVTAGLIRDSSSLQDKETLLLLNKERQTIGCEVCHGPAKSHATSPASIGMTSKISKNLCLTCHTDEHDDNFNYVQKLELISCPSDY